MEKGRKGTARVGYHPRPLLFCSLVSAFGRINKVLLAEGRAAQERAFAPPSSRTGSPSASSCLPPATNRAH